MIRWGILGAGRIARKFAADLQYASGNQLVAIGSRSRENADAFANEFPVSFQHERYEDLASNPAVDVVYIATPHTEHYVNVLLCLEHGKAVLCEKPFAMNLAQATHMLNVAKDKKLFLMEALWTRFLPHFIKTKALIDSGEIGTIKNLQVNFGFRPAAPVPKRLFDPSLGGGTIMDIGIYNVFLALSLLGKPSQIDAVMTPAVTGVDEQCAVLFHYSTGALAQLFSSFSTDLATEADIAGDRGRIRLTTRFYEPSATIEYYPGRVDSKTIIKVPKQPGFGYQYEAMHVGECVRNNLTESPLMRHEDTLLLTDTLDQIRAKAGIRYADDLQPR